MILEHRLCRCSARLYAPHSSAFRIKYSRDDLQHAEQERRHDAIRPWSKGGEERGRERDRERERGGESEREGCPGQIHSFLINKKKETEKEKEREKSPGPNNSNNNKIIRSDICLQLDQSMI